MRQTNVVRCQSWRCFICRYGRTSSDRAVDMDAVEQVQGMGFERRLCAEALRQVLFPMHAVLVQQVRAVADDANG